MKYKKLNWPLMVNNITKADRLELINFLKEDKQLTNGPMVEKFEEEWSKWLGVKYSVFVNSGASANLLTMNWLRRQYEGEVEVIVPPLTWVSDIATVIQNGMTPVFVDINPRTLGLDEKKVLAAITPKTKAVFITHVMGYSAFLSEHFLIELKRRGIILIEDCCEAHGAAFNKKKLGTYGEVSNFSFYYAHHMSTIEGGMICTNSKMNYEHFRMLRSHGMMREMKEKAYKQSWINKYPNLRPEFIFTKIGYNVRSTELNAVLGLSQLSRLDENNETRKLNLTYFLNNLDDERFFTSLIYGESCNYALTLIMRGGDIKLRNRIEKLLSLCQVEFRRGLSGGGNQLRQPYLERLPWDPKDFREVEHMSDFSWYIGNYPELSFSKIKDLTRLLNAL